MSNEHNDDILRDAEETRDNQNHPQDDGYEEFCFMCRRPESQTGKLIHLPGNLCVCSHCRDSCSSCHGSYNITRREDSHTH